MVYRLFTNEDFVNDFIYIIKEAGQELEMVCFIDYCYSSSNIYSNFTFNCF